MSTKKTMFYSILVGLIAALILSASLAPLVCSQTTLSSFLPITIVTTGSAWQGDLAFGASYTNSTTSQTVGYLVVMDANNGDVLFSRQSDQSYGVVKNIGLDTLMFQGEPVYGGASTAPVEATHFWNFVTNTTTDFPGVDGHHDIEYDPINNTFLTFTDYVKDVGSNSYLFDKIVQFDASGNILWSWDTYDHIPLSEADTFNLTAKVNGETVIDFTHANALDWDYNNSIIYLNCRHTNTFYKIDQNTGNIIWACGQFGNFTLLNADGAVVSSLWYHSHDLKEESPDVFSMFDNDFDNVTNPDNCRSQLIDVTLNEQNMTAYVSWNWTAPKQYWTPFFGSNDLLPNGDRIGDFGSPSHQYPQNEPWVGNDTGAVLVEVNQTGQVVRTFTFPTGWQIYRIGEITDQQPFTLPTPSSSPISSQFPTSSPIPTPLSTPVPTLPTSPSPSISSKTSPSLSPANSISPSPVESTPSTSPNSEAPSPTLTQSVEPSSTPNSGNKTSATFEWTIFAVVVTVAATCSAIYLHRRKK